MRWIRMRWSGIVVWLMVTSVWAEDATPAADMTASGATQGDVIYKWKDKDGTWHFSQTVPGGVDSQSLTYPHQRADASADANDQSDEKKAADTEKESATDQEKPTEVKKKKRKLIMPSSTNKPPETQFSSTPETTTPQSLIREGYDAGVMRGMQLERERARERELLREQELQRERCARLQAQRASSGGIAVGGGGLQAAAKSNGGLNMVISAPAPHDPGCN